MFSALLASLGSSWPSAAQAQATPEPAADPTAVSIEVDARLQGAPLKRVWAYYGYDELNYTTHPEAKDLLAQLVAANSAPVHVRTHFLFNTGDGTAALKWGSTNIYTEDEAGNPVFDFSIIDAVMDSMVQAGAFPFAELGFMPQALSTEPEPYQPSSPYVLEGGSFYPPRDYARWGELVAAWARHVEERYPGAGESWRWELWNEPDIGYWKGSFSEFTQLYDSTEAALHAVLPEARLGGPAVATPEGEFLARFLEHCASGSNFVTGQTGTRLDMVTFHSKGGVGLVGGQVQMNLGDQLRLHQVGFDTVARSPFASLPVVISEADPEGCAACPVSTAPQNAYRNSPAYGAYEVALMKRSLELANEAGVNLQGVLTWAFTFPDTPYFAGYRALATRGIQLPVFNAFQLLGQLRGNRLQVTSSGARPLSQLLVGSVRDVPDVDALATLDGQRLGVLVWNYHDELVAAEPTKVTLEVALPPGFGAEVQVRFVRVDGEHGDAHAVWVSQGSPERPSAEQLRELKAAMLPVTQAPQVVRAKEGVVRVSFDLPRFAVWSLTLTSHSASAQRDDSPQAAGCACQYPASRPASSAAWLVPLVPALLAARRRRRPVRQRP